MKYSEWDVNNELFSYIVEANQAFTSDQVQQIFNIRYSQRDVNLYLAFKSPNEVADMVSVLYSDKWRLLIEHFNSNDGLDVGATKRITETILTDELNSNENTNTQKETTFNSAELTDVSGSADVGTDEKKATVTRTYEETNSSVKNIDNRLKLMNIVDIMVLDVASLLLLSIY